MARVFTTDFAYNCQHYKALIVIREGADQQIIVQIRFFDSALIEVFGNDSIEFVGLSGYQKLNHFTNPTARVLLETISQTILHHLSKQ